MSVNGKDKRTKEHKGRKFEGLVKTEMRKFEEQKNVFSDSVKRMLCEIRQAICFFKGLLLLLFFFFLIVLIL